MIMRTKEGKIPKEDFEAFDVLREYSAFCYEHG